MNLSRKYAIILYFYLHDTTAAIAFANSDKNDRDRFKTNKTQLNSNEKRAVQTQYTCSKR